MTAKTQAVDIAPGITLVVPVVPADGDLTGGYGREALDAAFKMVASAADWKAPIDAVVWATDRAIVAEAIEFFTATTATFERADECGKLRVTSVGYRAGPAGP